MPYILGVNMNILQLLKKDHQHVKSLLTDIEKTTIRATRSRLEIFSQLKQALQAQEKIEESIFYPALKKNADSKKITLEAYEEHHLVDNILEEIDQTEPSDETWIAKIVVLKENILHHVKEEEGEIFGKARDILGEEKLEKMGMEMEKIKENE